MELKNKLDEASFIYNVKEYRTTYKFVISNKELCLYLSQFNRGAKNKRLTNDIFDLPKHLLESFLDGYIDSDGHFYEKNNLYSVTSISEELIYGIQQIVYKLYHTSTSINKRKGNKEHFIENRKVNQNDSFTLKFSKVVKNRQKSFFKDGYLWIPFMNKETKHEKNVVYNMSVDKDESYTINNLIVHNCSTFTVLTRHENLGKMKKFREGQELQNLDELYFCFLELANKIKPKVIISENVPGLTMSKAKPIYEEILKRFEEIGYIPQPFIFDSSKMGVPQSRKRLFIIGVNIFVNYDLIIENWKYNKKIMKLITNDYINRAKEVHGDRYDYSLVEYINSKTKIKIICKEHGEFEQRPDSHLYGKGCKICGLSNSLLTKYDFIKKAKSIHRDRYDYSLVEYIDNKTKIKIICKEHGIFEQTPNSHLDGSGCWVCNDVKLTKEEFIERAKQTHENKYDYSLVEYKNSYSKVKIICKEHGEFEQTPTLHMRGHGCIKCFLKEVTFTNEQFIEKAKLIHEDKYDYSLVEYKNKETKVKIICKEHGIFEQRPDNHLRGSGCSICSGNLLNKEEFIERSRLTHGDRYDYSLVEYEKCDEKVKIICDKHGVFEQTPKNHMKGNGCPQCPTIVSKPHQKVIDYLIELGLEENKDFVVNDRTVIKPMELDIYFSSLKLAIEIDGLYWHGKLESCRQNKSYLLSNEEKKNNVCKQKEIKLLRLTDLVINSEFEKTKKQITNFLMSSFNKELVFDFNERSISVEEATLDLPIIEDRNMTDFCFEIWNKAKEGDRFDKHNNGKGYSRRKLNSKTPAPTLVHTCHYDLFHWKYPRKFTKDELLRFASFPQDYDFCGTNFGYCISYSVPPLMMFQIAKEIRKQIFDEIMKK